MKMTQLVMLVITIAIALFILIPNLPWAADNGATIYRAKCAACRQDAAGKPAVKTPSLVSDEAQKASDDDLTKAVCGEGEASGSRKESGPGSSKVSCSVHSRLTEVGMASAVPPRAAALTGLLGSGRASMNLSAQLGERKKNVADLLFAGDQISGAITIFVDHGSTTGEGTSDIGGTGAD